MRAHRNMHVNHCHFGNSSKLESGSGLQNCMPVIDGVETKGMLGGSRLVRGHLWHDSCLSRAAKAYLGEERQGRMARHLTAHTPLKQRSEPLHRGGEHPEDRGRRQDHIAQIQAHIGSAQRVAGTSQRSNPDWQPSSDDQRSTPCALLFNGQIGLLENGLRQDQVFTVAKANITDVSPTPGGGRWCRVAVISIPWSPPTCGHQLRGTQHRGSTVSGPRGGYRRQRLRHFRSIMEPTTSSYAAEVECGNGGLSSLVMDTSSALS